MSNFTGMDIGQVRELAQVLGQKADEIQSLQQAINGKLNSTDWKGQDRQNFQSEWEGTHTTNLKNVEQALRDAQKKAMDNAQQQETTSSS